MDEKQMQFEAWFLGDGEKPEIIERGRKLQSYYDRWTAWQCALQSPQVTALVEAAKVASVTMKAAEQLIGSLQLHDQWHQTDKPHGAYHDLLFKRIDLDKAIATIEQGGK